MIARHGVPISVASVHSGVKVPMIRYYEQIGLLPKRSARKAIGGGTMPLICVGLFLFGVRVNWGSKSTPSAPYSPFRTTRINHARRSMQLRAPSSAKLNDGSTFC
jgi:hypothetical protein